MNRTVIRLTTEAGLLLLLCGCTGVDKSSPSIAEATPTPSLLPTVEGAEGTAPSAVQPVSYVAAAGGSEAEEEHRIPTPSNYMVATEAYAQPDSASSESVYSDPASTESVSQLLPDQVISAPSVVQLDFSEALGIATGQNPRLAFASARYREAYARLQSARTLWLPSLRAGVSYNHHEGMLQASDGRVLEASRSSLQGGLGALAVGAGSPMAPGLVAKFHAADAIFQPRIATQAACASRSAAEAANNDILLSASLAYLELLNSKQQLSVAIETRDNAQRLAELTKKFADTGQGSQADADRAQTEFTSRRIEVSRAEEAVCTASAALAQLLSLDPSTMLEPREPTIIPVDLVAPDVPVHELITTGLTQRPELSEAQHLVCEAVQRYRREKFSPFVPSVLLGVSQSGFGGGIGSGIDNSGGRFDLDAAVVWELRNLGFGERAKRNETRAQCDQARALQVATMDQVAREVVEAHTQVNARQGQITIAEAGVASATDSYTRNLSRIREGQGLPLEVLQSLHALDTAQREYVRTLVDYNEAQFRLQRALGWPIH